MRAAQPPATATSDTGSRSIGALMYPGYRWSFAGTVFASVAQSRQQFALGWLVIEIAVRDGEPARGPLYLGIVGFARFLPAVAFGAAGGVLADRLDRRRTLEATRAGLGVLAAIIGALTLSGLVGLPAVAAVAALSAMIFAVDARAPLCPGSRRADRAVAQGCGLWPKIAPASATLERPVVPRPERRP